tara:strand:- start:272 stop:961 length:690 start_codon:yes stop_codon:yes gene_type:complete
MNLLIYPNLELSSQEHMAFDEWMLIQSSTDGSFGLRVYMMDNTFSFGRNQKFSELEDHILSNSDSEVQVVRRPTGGGSVYHSSGIIYALSIPRVHYLYSLKILDLYKAIHEVLLEALSKLGIKTVLNKEESALNPKFCFDSPNQFDLMESKTLEKLGGSALKKSQGGILIEGSLECGLNKENFLKLFIEQITQNYDLNQLCYRDPKHLNCPVWHSLCDRYRSEAWKLKL